MARALNRYGSASSAGAKHGDGASTPLESCKPAGARRSAPEGVRHRDGEPVRREDAGGAQSPGSGGSERMPTQTLWAFRVMLSACQNQTSISASLLCHSQENSQGQYLNRPIMFGVLTQPPGNRQHPALVGGQSPQNVVSQIGCGFGHPAGGTSGIDAAASVRSDGKNIVIALGASSSSKTPGEDAAVEVAK